MASGPNKHTDYWFEEMTHADRVEALHHMQEVLILLDENSDLFQTLVPNYDEMMNIHRELNGRDGRKRPKPKPIKQPVPSRPDKKSHPSKQAPRATTSWYISPSRINPRPAPPPPPRSSRPDEGRHPSRTDLPLPRSSRPDEGRHPQKSGLPLPRSSRPEEGRHPQKSGLPLPRSSRPDEGRHPQRSGLPLPRSSRPEGGSHLPRVSSRPNTTCNPPRMNPPKPAPPARSSRPDVRSHPAEVSSRPNPAWDISPPRRNPRRAARPPQPPQPPPPPPMPRLPRLGEAPLPPRPRSTSSLAFNPDGGRHPPRPTAPKQILPRPNAPKRSQIPGPAGPQKSFLPRPTGSKKTLLPRPTGSKKSLLPKVNAPKAANKKTCPGPRACPGAGAGATKVISAAELERATKLRATAIAQVAAVRGDKEYTRQIELNKKKQKIMDAKKAARGFPAPISPEHSSPGKIYLPVTKDTLPGLQATYDGMLAEPNRDQWLRTVKDQIQLRNRMAALRHGPPAEPQQYHGFRLVDYEEEALDDPRAVNRRQMLKDQEYEALLFGGEQVKRKRVNPRAASRNVDPRETHPKLPFDYPAMPPPAPVQDQRPQNRVIKRGRRRIEPRSPPYNPSYEDSERKELIKARKKAYLERGTKRTSRRNTDTAPYGGSPPLRTMAPTSSGTKTPPRAPEVPQKMIKKKLPGRLVKAKDRLDVFDWMLNNSMDNVESVLVDEIEPSPVQPVMPKLPKRKAYRSKLKGRQPSDGENSIDFRTPRRPRTTPGGTRVTSPQTSPSRLRSPQDSPLSQFSSPTCEQLNAMMEDQLARYRSSPSRNERRSPRSSPSGEVELLPTPTTEEINRQLIAQQNARRNPSNSQRNLSAPAIVQQRRYRPAQATAALSRDGSTNRQGASRQSSPRSGPRAPSRSRETTRQSSPSRRGGSRQGLENRQSLPRRPNTYGEGRRGGHSRSRDSSTNRQGTSRQSLPRRPNTSGEGRRGGQSRSQDSSTNRQGTSSPRRPNTSGHRSPSRGRNSRHRRESSSPRISPTRANQLPPTPTTEEMNRKLNAYQTARYNPNAQRQLSTAAILKQWMDSKYNVDSADDDVNPV